MKKYDPILFQFLLTGVDDSYPPVGNPPTQPTNTGLNQQQLK